MEDRGLTVLANSVSIWVSDDMVMLCLLGLPCIAVMALVSRYLFSPLMDVMCMFVPFSHDRFETAWSNGRMNFGMRLT